MELEEMAYLTDDEAKTAICPFIRWCVNERGVIEDKYPPIYEHQPCQGSACKIAWRKVTETEGYCGIVGRPL